MAILRGWQCDNCGKIHSTTRGRNPYYDNIPAPRGWWRVERLTGGGDPEFCSLDCVEEWAKKNKTAENKRLVESEKKRTASQKKAAAAKKKKAPAKKKSTRRRTATRYR